MEELLRITDLTSVDKVPEPFIDTSIIDEGDYYIFRGRNYFKVDNSLSIYVDILFECTNSVILDNRMKTMVETILYKNRHPDAGKKSEKFTNIFKFLSFKKAEKIGSILIHTPLLFRDSLIQILNTKAITSNGIRFFMAKHFGKDIPFVDHDNNISFGENISKDLENKNISSQKNNNIPLNKNSSSENIFPLNDNIFSKKKKKKKQSVKHLVRFVFLHDGDKMDSVAKEVKNLSPLHYNEEGKRIICTFKYIPDLLVKSFYKFDQKRIHHPRLIGHDDTIFMFENNDLMCRKCKGYGHVEANCSNFLLYYMKRHNGVHFRHKNQVLLKPSRLYDTDLRVVFKKERKKFKYSFKLKINKNTIFHEIDCNLNSGLSEDIISSAWNFLKEYADKYDVVIKKPRVLNIFSLNKAVLLLENKINFRNKKTKRKVDKSNEMEMTDDIITVNNKQEVYDNNVQNANIDGNQNVKVNIKQNVRVDGKEEINLKNVQNVNIGSNHEVKVNDKQNVKVNNKHDVKLDKELNVEIDGNKNVNDGLQNVKVDEFKSVLFEEKISAGRQNSIVRNKRKGERLVSDKEIKKFRENYRLPESSNTEKVHQNI